MTYRILVDKRTFNISICSVQIFFFFIKRQIVFSFVSFCSFYHIYEVIVIHVLERWHALLIVAAEISLRYIIKEKYTVLRTST